MIKSIPSFRVKPQLQISKVSHWSNNLVRMITSINLGKMNDKQIKKYGWFSLIDWKNVSTKKLQRKEKTTTTKRW